jgi:hypothetical protein
MSEIFSPIELNKASVHTNAAATELEAAGDPRGGAGGPTLTAGHADFRCDLSPIKPSY